MAGGDMGQCEPCPARCHNCAARGSAPITPQSLNLYPGQIHGQHQVAHGAATVEGTENTCLSRPEPANAAPACPGICPSYSSISKTTKPVAAKAGTAR